LNCAILRNYFPASEGRQWGFWRCRIRLSDLVLRLEGMEFLRRSAVDPGRLGVFAGTFNPVTVAHVALAEAALAVVDEVVFMLPRQFPHKTYAGAGFAQRAELLNIALAGEPRFSAAACEGGLFTEIADECREAYGANVRLSFLCGRDAAERVANWEYGDAGAFSSMLTRFDLLVAARRGEYCPPQSLSRGFARLELSGAFDDVSATEVRARIQSGEAWEHLVPAATRRRVREIYTV
jgi:nicotinate-nucleotide adenylyltransferase